MEFDEIIDQVMQDERSHKVPLLYIVQILIVCEDFHLFKEAKNDN